MWQLTLDTNCLIAVDEGRPEAEAVKELLERHHVGEIDCAISVSSASEMQSDRTFLQNIETFNMRRDRLGFGALKLLPAILYWGVGFWDEGLYPTDTDRKREEQIFRLLFPNTEYRWLDYARANDLDPDDPTAPKAARWRNKLLDAQAYWAHEHAKRDFFVTTDRGFSRLERAGYSAKGTILSPSEARNVAT